MRTCRTSIASRRQAGELFTNFDCFCGFELSFDPCIHHVHLTLKLLLLRAEFILQGPFLLFQEGSLVRRHPRVKDASEYVDLVVQVLELVPEFRMLALHFGHVDGVPHVLWEAPVRLVSPVSIFRWIFSLVIPFFTYRVILWRVRPIPSGILSSVEVGEELEELNMFA